MGNDFRFFVTDFTGKEVELIGSQVRIERNESPMLPNAFPYCSVLIKPYRGFDKPFIEIITNMSADLAVDSKDGKIVYSDVYGFWKIKSGEPESDSEREAA